MPTAAPADAPFRERSGSPSRRRAALCAAILGAVATLPASGRLAAQRNPFGRVYSRPVGCSAVEPAQRLGGDTTSDPVAPGEAFVARIRLLNASTSCTWSSTITLQHHAGTMSVSRSPIPVSPGVAPGGEYTFAIPMRAPAAMGRFEERWELVDDRGAAFTVSGSRLLRLTVTVGARCTAAGGGRLHLTDQDPPRGKSMAPGERFTASWSLLNDGDCFWDPETRFAYVSGPMTLGKSTLAVGEIVQPGDGYTFAVPMQAPRNPGTYRDEWQLLGPDGVRLGDVFATEITVPAQH